MERIGFVPASPAARIAEAGLYSRHKIGFEAEMPRRRIEPEESVYSESRIGFCANLKRSH